MQTSFDIKTKGFCPPMTVVLVGTVIAGKVNFIEVAWFVTVNLRPPMIAVSLDMSRYSVAGIKQNQEFSVCIPDVSMKNIVDYCGLVSGREKDKSQLFEVFYNVSQNIPLICSCPVNLECVLHKTVEIPGRYIFIGEIVGAFARNDILENGRPNIEKANPLLLTMRDNRYWHLGTLAGDAWKDGLQSR